MHRQACLYPRQNIVLERSSVPARYLQLSPLASLISISSTPMPTHEIIYRRLENPYDEEKSAELASINPSGDYRGYSHKQYSGALARHKPFLQVWTPFDSIELERSAEACKSPAETTSYRESHDISIRLPLIGFTLAMLVGIAFLATGVGIAVASRQSYHSLANQQDTFVLRGFFSIMTSTSTTLPTEIIILCFSIVVTLCMEAIGFVHSMTLRSALAAESRLEFNTNLRLFTATKHQRWTSPNGIPANILMLLLLILSYASGTLALTPVSIEYATNNDDGTHTYIDQYYAYASAQPLIVLGTSILLQGIIVLSGLFKCQRLLRSTSVLDTTRALMYDYDLVAQAGRCMHPIGTTDIAFNPRKPSPLQPSVWSAHLAPKKVLLLAWCLVALYATWGGIILYLSNHAGEIQVPISGAVSCYLFGFGYELGFTGLGQWSFLPNTLSAAVGMVITIESGSIPVLFWLIIFVAFALLQGGLTFQLHLYEAIVNAVRDERAWRAASTKGATLSPNVLGTVLSNWPSVMLLVFKSLMRKLR